MSPMWRHLPKRRLHPGFLPMRGVEVIMLLHNIRKRFFSILLERLLTLLQHVIGLFNDTTVSIGAAINMAATAECPSERGLESTHNHAGSVCVKPSE